MADLGDGERFDQNLFKNRFNENYEKYYNHLLSDEYVDSLPESYEELVHDGLLEDITDLVEKGLINVGK